MTLARRPLMPFTTLRPPLPVRAARDPNSPRTGAITGAFSDLDYALAVTGTALGAYHGYKRNDSIGWAIAWGLLGGAFPIIALPIAYAQGYGQRKR